MSYADLSSRGSRLPVVFCAILLLGVSSAENLCRAVEEIPVAIRASLQENANSLSPLTVIWKRQNRVTKSQVEVEKILKNKFDGAFFESSTVRFRYQGGKHYVLSEEMVVGQDKRLMPLRTEVSFDLVNFYSGNKMEALAKRGADPLLTITPLEEHLQDHPDWYALTVEYPEECGFRLPAKYSEVGKPASSMVAFLMEQGAEVRAVTEAKVEQVNCVVVELVTAKRVYRFYLDPSRHHAVRRRDELTPPGSLALRADHLDFVKMSRSDVWLPKRIQIGHYTWHSRKEYFHESPLLQTEFTVSELSDEPIADNQFVLNYIESGTVIGDGSLPEAKDFPDKKVTYTIPANPDDLDRAIASARKGEPFKPTIRTSLWRIMLVSVNGVAAILIFIWFRRSQK